MMQNHVIRSDDPQAVEKLQAKLDKLTAMHARMKEINAYFRKHATALGCPGLSDEDAAKLDRRVQEGYSWESSRIRPTSSAAIRRRCVGSGSASRRYPGRKAQNMWAGTFRAAVPKRTRRITACGCILTKSPRRSIGAS